MSATPQREEAKSKSDRELIVEHDDIIFGGWLGSGAHPKRDKGLLERLWTIELGVKIGIPLLAIMALRSLGVPTDVLWHLAGAVLGLKG